MSHRPGTRGPDGGVLLITRRGHVKVRSRWPHAAVPADSWTTEARPWSANRTASYTSAAQGPGACPWRARNAAANVGAGAGARVGAARADPPALADGEEGGSRDVLTGDPGTPVAHVPQRAGAGGGAVGAHPGALVSTHPSWAPAAAWSGW